MGDSTQLVRQAMDRLKNFSDTAILKSSLWKTSPVNCPPDSPDFINAVVGLLPRAHESPEELLRQLKEMEKEFGRRPKRRMNEPRPLDLDLIVFGRQIRNSPQLILPHPRAIQRKFVLLPLREVAPHLMLPGQQETVARLAERLPPGEIALRLCEI